MIESKLQEQFVEIINEYKKIVFKVCNLYCSNEEERKDLFQDIVYQLWKAFPAFKGEAKISTWIYRVALNTAMNYLRKNESSKGIHIPLFDTAAKYYPHQEFDDDRLKQLEAGINQLYELDKAIIILYLEGVPHEEIGAIVGITKSNVGTRINRIKEKLKKIITDSQGVNHG